MLIDEFFNLLQKYPGQLHPDARPIYRTLLQKTLSFSVRQGLSKEDAEEVAQEVFWTLLQNAGQLQDVTHPSAYFWRMVRNRIISLNTSSYKKAAKNSVEAEDQFISDAALGSLSACSTAPHTVFAKDSFLRCVQSVFREFSKKRRDASEAIILAAEAELSLEDISRVINRSYGATRELISKERKVLQGMVNNRCGSSPTSEDFSRDENWRDSIGHR